jgi:hypothetical protein
MSTTSLDAKSAFSAMKSIQQISITNPNDELLKQLQKFEEISLKGVKKKLLNNS